MTQCRCSSNLPLSVCNTIFLHSWSIQVWKHPSIIRNYWRCLLISQCSPSSTLIIAVSLCFCSSQESSAARLNIVPAGPAGVPFEKGTYVHCCCPMNPMTRWHSIYCLFSMFFEAGIFWHGITLPSLPL